MAPQAPWTPTAHAFALHQYSHVANFWKQGRQAGFRLEALQGGRAELNLTFHLPPASEVIPPPTPILPGPAQRPIHPLFPKGSFSQESHAKKPPPQKKASSKQRKNFRRSVLHRAALAAPSLPPPKNGSLRQAAQACVQRLQAVSASPVSIQSVRKRPLPDSPSAPFLSNILPLAQRIRSDIQVGECEVVSPEKEILRSSPLPENPTSPIPLCAKSIPPPAPLVFTPEPPKKSSCANCEAEMMPDHQCKSGGEESEIIGINEVDVKESVEIAKVLEVDKSEEDEHVIGSARVEQIESAKIEQGLESVLKPTQVEQVIEQVIESAKVEQTEVIEQVIESAKVEQAEVYYCYNCGLEGHFARECPFERLKYSCYTCGGEGHFARDCDK